MKTRVLTESPPYLQLYDTGELEKRVEIALAGMAHCRFCPWECQVNRLDNETKACHTGRFARVCSYFPHMGEERCLSGSRGSGTIFFNRCNLRCVFCQNADISQEDGGVEVSPQRLAQMMLELQELGCHNINLVTPQHIVPQILESLPYAIESGLRLPIVYNTNGYDSLNALRLLDGVVDIYLPDFKFWSEKASRRYLSAPQYPEAARTAIHEMHRQVGDLVFDGNGIAQRGLLIRHLLMPGSLEETHSILRFVSESTSPDAYINLMDQYRPAARVNDGGFNEINRPITIDERREAKRIARQVGLNRIEGIL